MHVQASVRPGVQHRPVEWLGVGVGGGAYSTRVGAWVELKRAPYAPQRRFGLHQSSKRGGEAADGRAVRNAAFSTTSRQRHVRCLHGTDLHQQHRQPTRRAQGV
jgi:hypothetical protein